jgi:hypothetical protein
MRATSTAHLIKCESSLIAIDKYVRTTACIRRGGGGAPPPQAKKPSSGSADPDDFGETPVGSVSWPAMTPVKIKPDPGGSPSQNHKRRLLEAQTSSPFRSNYSSTPQTAYNALSLSAFWFVHQTPPGTWHLQNRGICSRLMATDWRLDLFEPTSL